MDQLKWHSACRRQWVIPQGRHASVIKTLNALESVSRSQTAWLRFAIDDSFLTVLSIGRCWRCLLALLRSLRAQIACQTWSRASAKQQVSKCGASIQCWARHVLPDDLKCLTCLMVVDHISAAWRVAKIRDFEQRLKNLGLQNVQAASTLLHQLQVSTAALDELQQEQQVSRTSHGTARNFQKAYSCRIPRGT